MEFITAPDKADYIELGDAVNISSNSMWRHKKRMLLFAAVYGFGLASRAVDGTSHLFFAWSRLQRAVFSENLCAFIMKNGVVVFFRRQDAPPTWDARAFLATVRPDIVPQEVRTGIRRKI